MSTSQDPPGLIEIESRVKLLESHFLGSSTDHSVFAPVSTIRKRIDSFCASKSSGSSPESFSQSKLPPVTLPTFNGSDLDIFLKRWQRWLRLCGLEHAPDQAKLDWLIEACTPRVLNLVEKVVEENNNLHQVLCKREELFPKLENDITLRSSLEKIPQLPASPEPNQVAQLLVEFEEILANCLVLQCQSKRNFCVWSENYTLNPFLSSDLIVFINTERKTMFPLRKHFWKKPRKIG